MKLYVVHTQKLQMVLFWYRESQIYVDKRKQFIMNYK
jgi:hypothetical protein